MKRYMREGLTQALAHIFREKNTMISKGKKWIAVWTLVVFCCSFLGMAAGNICSGAGAGRCDYSKDALDVMKNGQNDGLHFSKDMQTGLQTKYGIYSTRPGSAKNRALFFVPLFSMIIVIVDRCKGIFRRYHLRVFYSERFLKLLFVQKDKDGKKRECPIF